MQKQIAATGTAVACIHRSVHRRARAAAAAATRMGRGCAACGIRIGVGASSIINAACRADPNVHRARQRIAPRSASSRRLTSARKAQHQPPASGVPAA